MGQKYPNINLFYKWTHRDRTAKHPCMVHDDITMTIMLRNMHAHFRAAIICIFQKVFSNGLKLNPWIYATHWIIIFISDPSLTQLDLIIWFSLYLIKVACFETWPLEQLVVCVVVPKCHNYKILFECQLSIIIVNCFHVLSMKYQHYVHIYTGLLHLRGHQMFVCLFTNNMKFEIPTSS